MPVVLSKEHESRGADREACEVRPSGPEEAGEENSPRCNNRKTKVDSVCFRCVDCGEVVLCPNCNHGGGCNGGNIELQFQFPGRGGCGHPPRSFSPRGGLGARGRGFHSPQQLPFRPPFGPPDISDHGRGGFGPRGFGGFSPRHPFPTAFGPSSEHSGFFGPMGASFQPFESSEMHGRGFGFDPRNAGRGRACFPRGGRGMGVERGRCDTRGRGGHAMFAGFANCGDGRGVCVERGRCGTRGRGGFAIFAGNCGDQEPMGSCGDCDHPRVYPVNVAEDLHGANCCCQEVKESFDDGLCGSAGEETQE